MMRKPGCLVWLGILLLMMQGDGASTLHPDGARPVTESGKTDKEQVEKEWVVQWKQGEVNPDFLQTIHILHRTQDPTGHVTMLVHLKRNVREDQWLERWSTDERVKFIHPNQKYKVEKRAKPIGDTDGGLYYLDQIGVAKAWDKVSLDPQGKRITVAVVDTGVEGSHPALQPFLTEGINLKDASLPPEDQMGHGTHVAGVIAEIWRGWAEEWESPGPLRIMPVKVLEDGQDGDVYFTAEGIREAVRRGADVIVLAQGSWAYSETMGDAVQFAEANGAVVVGATGNARISSEGEIRYNQPIYYPAAFPIVLGVGSVNREGKVVPTSNMGPGIDVVAPGEGIRAAVRGGKYGVDSGTSFATPQVGALAAVVMHQHPEFSPADVRDLIRQTARPAGEERWNTRYGFGQLDGLAALTESPRRDIYEPNDKREDAMPFSVDQQVRGVLKGEADRDCFQVTAPTSGMLTLRLQGSDQGWRDVTMTVTIADRSVRYQGKKGERVRISRLDQPVTACLSSSGEEPWNYQLENHFLPEADGQENNDHQWNAYNVKVHPGYQPLDGTLHKKRDADWYRLEFPDPGRLELGVEILSPRGDPVLYMQREGSWKGHKQDEKAEGEREVVSTKVESGLYVRVTDYGTNPIDAPYRLVIHFVPEDGDALEPNQTSDQAAPLKEGRLTRARFDGPSDLDWYNWSTKAEAEQRNELQVPQGAQDVMLLLYDNRLQVIERLRLSAGENKGTLQRRLPKGEYYLRVQGSPRDRGKEYRLRVSN